ncbi:hypothetical protein ACQ4N7_11100 [Nodosilinea sp. AN01ver1]|uniref:hypothetical protein n=1 Tax=Nodosilinea sp. AN01ver1 TaxID=3423362 RepID=UPI003D31E243
MAGAILWSSPSQAQGFCYLVNSEGEVVNLDDLCASDNDAQPVQSQTEASGVGEAATETQEGTSSGNRSYTITGPGVVPGSSATPASSAADQPGAADESAETTPESTTDPAGVDGAATEAEAGTEPRPEENRLDIPVREIETPQIPTPQTQPPRVTTPEAQDPTVDTTDTTDGTDRTVVPTEDADD